MSFRRAVAPRFGPAAAQAEIDEAVSATRKPRAKAHAGAQEGQESLMRIVIVTISKALQRTSSRRCTYLHASAPLVA
jgi:hypothetical protein